MSYISELRALIGKRPLVMAGASVLVLDPARPGHMLLQRRADNGLWGNPGGVIDPGESAEQTAVREVAEETGFRIGEPDLVTVVSGGKVRYTYPNGDEVWNVTIVFTAEILSAEPEDPADGETLELRWFELDALPHDMSPPSRVIISEAAGVAGMRQKIYRTGTDG